MFRAAQKARKSSHDSVIVIRPLAQYLGDFSSLSFGPIGIDVAEQLYLP